MKNESDEPAQDNDVIDLGSPEGAFEEVVVEMDETDLEEVPELEVPKKKKCYNILDGDVIYWDEDARIENYEDFLELELEITQNRKAYKNLVSTQRGISTH